MIGYYTKFTTLSENREALVQLLVQAAASMEEVLDYREYVVNTDKKDDKVIWVTEIWESNESHKASLTHPNAKGLIAQAMPLLIDKPMQILLNPIAGKGM